MAIDKSNLHLGEDADEMTGARFARDSKAPKNNKSLIGAIGCLVVGLLVGYFLAGHLHGSALNKSTLAKSDLDCVVASYNSDGSHKVTAREVLESAGGLQQYQVSEDAYRVPAADAILGYVRQQVILSEAKKQGLEANDEELNKYAKEVLGADKVDWEKIAKANGTTADEAKDRLRESATIKKLYDKKMEGKKSDAVEPKAPEKCEEGSETEKTAAYADYIKTLLGSNWNKDENKWANELSMYYQALSHYEFDGSEASYEMAAVAYQIALQEYAGEQQSSNAEWVDYVNGLFSNSSITIYTLQP